MAALHPSPPFEELTFKEGFWILHDLNSTNGVLVNDTRLDKGAKKMLHNGDLLTIKNYEPAMQDVP